MEGSAALLNKEFIFLDYEADTKEELLENLSNILKDKGYVKDSYINGVLEREKVFPTGLNTLGVSVAIPHTDAKHVEKPTILVAKLKKPVIFKEMGDGINDVEAKLIFMLAIKNPEEQLTTLRKLVSIFSDEQKILSVYNSKSTTEIYEILKSILDN